jgi:glucose/mannose transport system substrate-binding protein
VLPPGVADIMKYDGHWVAAPVNVHRLDWLYANPKVLEKAGIAVPKTWDEFNAAADKLMSMGITPLAHGGQAWQDASLWEIVVLGVGGPDFHEKALVKLDPEALNSETMIKVFDQMRKLRGYVGDNFSGRDWNLATTMVMNGEAAFQIMGDWVKGEFMAAGKVPGKDFICANPPDTDKGYLYIIDSFAMFKQPDADKQKGQIMFASLLMGPKFQETFNLYKGSIPVRTDISLDKFDDCAKASKAHMLSAAASGGFQPSATHDMSVGSAVKGAIFDVVTKHFNSDMSSADAAKALADAIAAEK